MEIVIVGGGKLGTALCRDLANEGHEIVLIDQSREVVEDLTEDLDIRGVVGNGSARQILQEADVQACDVFISVTPSDETNLIAGIIADRLGAKYSIARVRGTEYANDLPFFKKELGIDLLINTDALTAADIVRGFDYPFASSIEPFGNGRVTLVNIRVNHNAPIIGRTVASLRAEIPDLLLCVIERNFQAVIPKGPTVIYEDDYIQLTGDRRAIDQFSRLCGHPTRNWRSALIVGASRISHYLVPALLDRGVQIKVIESNPDRANRLAIAYPNIQVIQGDGTSQRFLREERIKNYDVAVALTNIDEENIMLSLFAHAQGVRKTIAKVNRSELVKLIDPEGLDLVVTPHISTGDVIIRYIRSHEKTEGSALETYSRLSPEGVEALEFIAEEGDDVTKAPIMELKIEPEIVIANILRGRQRIIPKGTDQIEAGDRVLIVSARKRVTTLDGILIGEAQ